MTTVKRNPADGGLRAISIIPLMFQSVLTVVLVLLAVGLGAIYMSYRHDLNQARERVAHGSRVVETRCGPIEYAVVGSGPPVLVVHGAGGGFDQGLLVSQRLTDAGFQVIAMSRFGYLRTPLPDDASAAAQADAHACLLEALGIERAAVLGASAGAPSALQFVLRHPKQASALILLVPATYLPQSGSAGTRVPPGLAFFFNTVLTSDFWFWFMSRVARSSLIRTILGTPPELVARASAGDQAEVARMLDAIQPISWRRLGLRTDAEVTTSLRRYELERIEVPTLIISAEDDGYGTYERARYTAGEIPGAKFVGYPSGGHLLVGRQQPATADIVALLRQVNGSR